uniref:PBS lyase n=1 Tax=Desulfobacca acetoxidans TaxID=60893 RepID=A0A7C5EMJ5_9BACT
MLNLSRESTKPPYCPFCRQIIPRPHEVEGLWFEFDGGVCSCGTHFAVDPTARNGGAVLLQALVQACDGDWDYALSLAPEVDYEEAYLGRYNSQTHRVGGLAFGTIYFVRLKEKAPHAEVVSAK